MAKEKLRCQVAGDRHARSGSRKAPFSFSTSRSCCCRRACSSFWRNGCGRPTARQQRISAGAARGTSGSTKPIWGCRKPSCAPCALFQPGQEKNIWHKGTIFLPPLTVSLGIHSCPPKGETEAVNQFIAPNTIPTPRTESSNSPGQLLAQRSRAEGRRIPKSKAHYGATLG